MLKIITIVMVATALMGCGPKGPPELTLEQVPEALKNAFATARPAMKTNADSVAKLVSEKQYAAASLQLGALGANTQLTDDQRNIVAGATIAVNAALQEMAASLEPAAGEAPAEGAKPAAPPASKEDAAAAAAVLEHHIRTK